MIQVKIFTTQSYYRPQTKFAKVMFLHLSVSHSVHGGGCPGPGPGGCILTCTEADTPQQTATAADGTHPTGMHSCYKSDTKGVFTLSVNGNATMLLAISL